MEVLWLNPLRKRSMAGQTAMLELMVGTIMVLLIVTTLIGFWDKSYSSSQESRIIEDLDLLSSKVLTALVETSGAPADWETRTDVSTGVLNMGLAKNPLILNRVKLEKFHTEAQESARYGKIKELLGLSNLEFQLQVFDMSTGTKLALVDGGLDYSQPDGNRSVSGLNYVMKKQRVVTMEDKPLMIEMTFYYPKKV